MPEESNNSSADQLNQNEPDEESMDLAKIGYSIGLFLLGIVIMAALMGLVYSHLWLTNLTSIEKATTIISDSAEQNLNFMEDLRVLSSVILVVSLPLTAYLSKLYYKSIEDVDREIKFSVAFSLVMLVAGIALYLLASQLFIQSAGISLIILNSVNVILSSTVLTIRA